MNRMDERKKAQIVAESIGFLQDISFFSADDNILQEIHAEARGRSKQKKEYQKLAGKVAAVILSIVLIASLIWSVPIARAYISLFIDRVILNKAPITLHLGIERAIEMGDPQSNNFGLYQTLTYGIDGTRVNVSVEPQSVNTQYYSDRVYEHIGIITGSPTGEPASCYRDDESVSAVLLVGEQRIIIAVYDQNFDLLKEIVCSMSIQNAKMEVAQ